MAKSLDARVLIVDDSRTVRNRVRQILADDRSLGFDVSEAADGFQALTHLANSAPEHLPDVILLDRNMPVMSGDACITILRTDPIWSLIPVIFLTAQASKAEVVKGLMDLGADDYLPKPFDANEMLARVKALIRMKKAEDAQRLAFTNLEHAHAEVKEHKNLLALANEHLEHKVFERTAELAFEKAKLDRLVRLGINMAAERYPLVLLQSVLDGALEISGADGGTLYLTKDGTHLEFNIIRNGTLKIHRGGSSGIKIDLPMVPLYNNQGEENYKNVASTAFHRRQTINIADVYKNEEFDFTGTRKFDEAMSYRSQSMLTVPLIPRGGTVVGVLQLINALNTDGYTAPFSREVQSFVEALAAQSAMTLDNQNLLNAQKDLLDSFIKLIAGAIDAKSPYTGGHCERVPELARILAEAACAEKDGPFADFSIDTDDEWREFKVASWLHDCGKVTTPEYVVDKATKLETIYNRIHEIRTRFEVLWRDAEIEHLKLQISAEELAARQQQLRDDFAFVAESNVGGEFMSPDKVARLEKIAQTRWTRYFDDRLGLSNDEAKRKPETMNVDPPVEEFLLGDRPDHVIPRTNPNPFGDNRWGFKMDIPTNLYNLGELYNLRIARGTLTNEERFKINEHITQTLIMLGNLPFPKNLERVPEIAGAHHETMIGTGYPRKLKKEDMSVPARIMAIADVFEALTASDRPYKKAKTLSESLKIMMFMVKDQHLDGDLFDLFLESGAYLEYANRFLLPDQIDSVDITQFKRKPPPPPTTTVAPEVSPPSQASS